MADHFAALKQHLSAVDAAIKRCTEKGRGIEYAKASIKTLRVVRQDDYGGRVATPQEKAALAAVQDATRDRFIADLTADYIATLRAASIEIDAIRDDLCVTAARCAIQLGAIARELRDDAAAEDPQNG
jgi:hypothetical protein